MRSIWSTPRAVAAHLTLALLEPAFGAAAWWQTSRALSGNSLSWLYVFEWPFFGVYAVVLWWRIVHDQDGAARSTGDSEPSTDAPLGETPPDGVRLGRLARSARWLAAPLVARGAARSAQRAAHAAQRAANEASELAAYNRHLAALAGEQAELERAARREATTPRSKS